MGSPRFSFKSLTQDIAIVPFSFLAHHVWAPDSSVLGYGIAVNDNPQMRIGVSTTITHTQKPCALCMAFGSKSFVGPFTFSNSSHAFGAGHGVLIEKYVLEQRVKNIHGLYMEYKILNTNYFIH
jgi:hypothetical protein